LRAPSPLPLRLTCRLRPATADVFVLGYFTVAGAGKYSVDEQILGGELEFYKENIFDQLPFNKE
jgi:hypothetical protein